MKKLYRNLKDNVDCRFLLMYWLIVSACFLLAPYFSQIFTGKPVNKLPNLVSLLINHWTILCYFIIGLLAILIFYSENKLWMRIIFSVSLGTLLYKITSNISLYNVSYDDTGNAFNYLIRYSGMRTWFLISISVIVILLFNIILYSYINLKLLADDTYKGLVHKRYLEYMHNFIWISVFGLLTFMLLYLNLLNNLNKTIVEPEGYPRVVWLIQLLFISFCSIGLILYAFHIKLKEIEDVKTK